MDTHFIGQGLDLNSSQFGEIIKQELNNHEYTNFTCFVAFLSEGAINRMHNELSAFISRGNNITFYVGVHNGGTSKQALESLLDIGIEVYVFYNSRLNPIYHPKAYVFKNSSNYSIFVGSNNFTSDGLYRNIEGALNVRGLIHTEGQVLNDIETFFSKFLDNSDLNISLLDEELINHLENQGLIPNQHDYYGSSNSVSNNPAVQRPNTDSYFPLRPVQSLPPRVSLYGNQREIPRTINEQGRPNENTEAQNFHNTIWFETRTLTSGSRNQLDLSSSGIDTGIGGIDLFNPSRQNNLEITIRYLNLDYFLNPIYYPEGGVRPNGSWRLSMRGRAENGLKFTEHTRNCNLCNSVLLFHRIEEDYYELEILPESELQSIINQSSFYTHGPNNGRYYGAL
ncbi:phospholipase D-like domain-containing protein [Exiguobacterium mexicanum]